jgi:hypothetical protein
MAGDTRSIVEDVTNEKAESVMDRGADVTLSPEEDRRLLRKIDMW